MTGITAESYGYPWITRGADDPDFTKPTTIQVYSNANGLDSFEVQSFTLRMTGGPGILVSPGRWEFGSVVVGDLTI